MTASHSSDHEEILVIGAGELGGSVVAALIRRDDAPEVTVLLRRPALPGTPGCETNWPRWARR